MGLRILQAGGLLHGLLPPWSVEAISLAAVQAGLIAWLDCIGSSRLVGHASARGSFRW
jgi:hypothetical protein